MPLLSRLGNTVVATNCDFTKHSYSSPYYQDLTIKKYMLTFLNYGFSFKYLYNDFRFFKFISHYNTFKSYVELLWYNYLQCCVIYDSESMMEIESFYTVVRGCLLDAYFFNVWVLKYADWIIFTCFMYNYDSILKKNIALLGEYVESFKQNTFGGLFYEDCSIALNL